MTKSIYKIFSMAMLLALYSGEALAKPANSYLDRLPSSEITYFLLPDRFENGDKFNDLGGLKGDRLVTGFDPTAKGFYHGGDLRGIINRLDYIQGMGATAIWLSPIFKNKPVQGPKGDESAGYHGYWITDFTTIDPHIGTEAEFRELVNAAHKRGMKVYMDIVVNHTADVIKYRDCPANFCAYRNISDYPKKAYDAYVPSGEENVKSPKWLNDTQYYYNRGDSEWWGESAIKGDFSGLDDLDTTNPKVIDGMIEIYGSWIDRFKVDGFRIDTFKHVDSVLWQKFVPAIKARAAMNKIPNFHIFGEAAYQGMNPGALAIHTWRDKLPNVLDFSFQSAIFELLAKNNATETMRQLADGDVLYHGGFGASLSNQTFTGNHDMGRLAMQIRKENPKISDEEILARIKLSNALLMLWRGSPTIYSGDEQGFTGDGGDQDAREDMFASKTAVYNDNVLLGSKSTNAVSNFNSEHPLYKEIQELAKIRNSNSALSIGDLKILKTAIKPGILAFSRQSGNSKYVLVFNTSNETIEEGVATGFRSSIDLINSKNCQLIENNNGNLKIKISPFEYAICKVK